MIDYAILDTTEFWILGRFDPYTPAVPPVLLAEFSLLNCFLTAGTGSAVTCVDITEVIEKCLPTVKDVNNTG